MLARFLIATIVASFILGFVKPMMTSGPHTILSVGTYLFIWWATAAFERQKRQPSPLLHVLFWATVTAGLLTLVIEFVPPLAQSAAFIRALVILLTLIYCASAFVRLHVDAW
jgi:hypothetical protein